MSNSVGFDEDRLNAQSGYCTKNWFLYSKIALSNSMGFDEHHLNAQSE